MVKDLPNTVTSPTMLYLGVIIVLSAFQTESPVGNGKMDSISEAASLYRE